MSLYAKIQQRPRLFVHMTGLSPATFATLLTDIETAHALLELERKERTVVGNKPRQRAIGGGKSYGNSLADRVLMLLLYHRLYLTQEFMTLLFKAEHKSVISRSMASVEAAVKSVLPIPSRLKSAVLSLAERGGKKPKRIDNVADFVRAYPELTILIDGKEQPVPRPKSKEKRKSRYSGKKKRHTLKQLITTTRNGLIVDLSPPVDGSVHDFSCFKDYADTLCDGWQDFNTVAYVDSGFQGQEDLNLPIQVRQIHKAFRNKPLTKQQKQINTLRSKIRVKCEHSIGHLKRYRIANDTYRNPPHTYQVKMDIAAGLTNLRIIQRIQNQTNVTFNY